MADFTRLLQRVVNGDATATDELFPLIYEELRQLAAQRLAKERANHTLQATALVHEVYVRLVDASTDDAWEGRAHFFGAAAQAMRRILVDSARQKKSRKRGGDKGQIDFNQIDVASKKKASELLAVDEALTAFEAEEPDKAELVKLRYYAGMSIPEAAKVLGISVATANRRWAYSKAWLQQQLEK